MAGPGIPSRPGEAGLRLELVHCPRTMGGTMGGGGGLYPRSLSVSASGGRALSSTVRDNGMANLEAGARLLQTDPAHLRDSF